MTIDSPLSCYICGEVSDRKTVDLIGCFRDQTGAAERFSEKHDHPPDGYIDICSGCRNKHPNHTENAEAKYGVYAP